VLVSCCVGVSACSRDGLRSHVTFLMVVGGGSFATKCIEQKLFSTLINVV